MDIKIIKCIFKLYLILIFGILLPIIGISMSFATNNPFLSLSGLVLLSPVLVFATKKLVDVICDIIQEVDDEFLENEREN